VQPTYEIVGDKILHFQSVLLNPGELISAIEGTTVDGIGEWLPWLSHGDEEPHQYGHLKELNLSKITVDTDNKISTLIQSIYSTLDACYKAYYIYLGLDESLAQVYVDKFKSNRPSHIAIKKYFVGEELGPHPDWEGEDPVVFTASMYLNTDYKGGTLSFPSLGASVQATPGSVVIFPSSYLHESTKIVEGTKYVTNVLAELPKSVVDGLL